MARQAHGGGAVLAVGSRVGQGVHVDGTDGAVLARAQADVDLHIVAGGAGDKALLPGVDHLGRPAGLPGDKGGVNFRYHRLLGAETAADAGLLHVDLGLGNVQGVGQNAPDVEDDLGGGNNMEPPIGVHLGIGAEGLHHSLVAGGGVVDMVNDIVTLGQNVIHVSVRAHLAGAQVALVVRANRAQRAPVFLGVHQNRAVQGLVGVQYRLQHLVLHLDELQRLVCGRLILGGHDGHSIAHKADALIQNQTVIGRGLGVGLTRHGKALLGHILVGIYGNHAGHLLGHVGVDLLNEGVGVGAAQHLHHQAVLRGHIVHIGGLTQQQGHGVLFPYRLAYGL